MPDDVTDHYIKNRTNALNSNNPKKELFSVFLSLESDIYNRALQDAICSIREYPHADLIIEKIRSFSLSTLPPVKPIFVKHMDANL